MTVSDANSCETVDSVSEDWEETSQPPAWLASSSPHVLVFYVREPTQRFLSPDDVRTGREVLRLWKMGVYHRLLVVGDSRLPQDARPRVASSVAAAWLVSGGILQQELLPVVLKQGSVCTMGASAGKELQQFVQRSELDRVDVTICGDRQDIRSVAWILTRFDLKAHRHNVRHRTLTRWQRLKAFLQWLTLDYFMPMS